MNVKSFDRADPADQALARRFERLVPGSDGLDWEDVARRADGVRAHAARRRHRLIVIAATLGAVSLVAAPAFALRDRLVRFFDREPAPSRVEKAFAALDVGAPPQMAPGVLPNQARRVASFAIAGGAETTLWVAPTRQGGFCYFFSRALGGCRSKSENSAGSPYVIGFGMTAPRGDVPFVIGGDVPASSAVEKLEIRFEDGEEDSITLTWVSAPIGAGFYLYEVPAAHSDSGHRPVALVGLDRDGREVASQTLPTVFPKPR